MFGRLIILSLAVVGVVLASGCNPVSEPWDQTEYFKNFRSHPPMMKKELRDRLMYTERYG